jgi:predicted GIY-YIG superfamily endonuclease
MSAFIHPPAARTSYSSIIHREPGSITGLRKIFDRITRLSVWTFPFSMIDEFAPRLMAVPAAYILADHRSIYVGESHNVGRRLLEHSTDNSKLFAREVFVISAFDTEWFDKASAIQLQHRLTHLAKASGLVELRLGANPQDIALSSWLLGTNDGMFDAAPRLLFDAGCRAFHSNCDSQLAFATAGPAAGSTGEGSRRREVTYRQFRADTRRAVRHHRRCRRCLPRRELTAKYHVQSIFRVARAKPDVLRIFRVFFEIARRHP